MTEEAVKIPNIAGLPSRMDLQALIMTGVVDKIFNIRGQQVHMGLLTEKEALEVRIIIGSYDLITQEQQMRIETLARAIFDINGQSFDDDEAKKIKFLKNALGLMQTPIIVEFWNKYNELRQIQMVQLGEDDLDVLKKSSGNPGSETSGNS